MSNFDFGFFLTLFPFAVKSAVLMFILTFPYRTSLLSESKSEASFRVPFSYFIQFNV